MSITEFSCPFLRRGKFPCVALAGSVALDQMAPARERLLLAAPPPPAWLTNAAVGLVVSATGVLRSTFESGPLATARRTLLATARHHRVLGKDD